VVLGDGGVVGDVEPVVKVGVSDFLEFGRDEEDAGDD
jgi:hypothetical protein